MSENHLTLGALLGRTVIDEIIILPQEQGEQQGEGYTVAKDGDANKVFTRSNNEEIYLAPDTVLEPVKGDGPYEGITFYRIVTVGTVEEDVNGMSEKAYLFSDIVHSELLIHLKEKGALDRVFDRRIDLEKKMRDLTTAGNGVKEIVDVIQSAAMLLYSLGVEPEIALYNRNSELRHRLAQTGSMLRKK